jgi:hypothetical protein
LALGKTQVVRRNFSQPGKHIGRNPGRGFRAERIAKVPSRFTPLGKDEFQAAGDCFHASPRWPGLGGVARRLAGSMVQFRLLVGHVHSKLGEPRLAYLQLAALHLSSDKQGLSVSSLKGKEEVAV